MPKFIKKRWHGLYIVALFIVAAVFIGIVTFQQWVVGVVGYIVLAIIAIYSVIVSNSFKNDLEEYISTLSYRVHRANEEAIMELPIGMVLYDHDFTVQWTNPYITKLYAESVIGKDLSDLSDDILDFINSDKKEQLILIFNRYYQIQVKRDEKIVYFFDVTDIVEMQNRYDEEQPVIAFITLDNYDEVTQGMDDQVRSRISSQVTSTLNKWAKNYEVLLRRTGSDRFIAFLNKRSLEKIEKTKFVILDEIREQTSKEKLPITLSIGVGLGEVSFQELGEIAQSSLDLALGRGGDQVAIKEKHGKVRFYGGKSNAIEKRTRVRARVISHALRDFVLESQKVLVMGHKSPDMDAIGASIGVLKIAELNDKKGYIVLDQNDTHSDVKKLMHEIEMNETLWSKFISPERALEIVTDQTLLVIVDTHKPSLVIEPALLNKVDRVIVLDHHRRSEEFIKDPVLVYMEPYASSTAELVTELIEYQPKKPNMDILEATALLAGIIVDTKSFAVRTGSRTFDAASFLRQNGADTTLVQQLLKEDLDQYVKRAKLIERAQIYKKGIAISRADEEDILPQVLIAQAADTLLTLDGIVASFVISKVKGDRISISARSLGDINVQLIMEKLGGGGHLTNAATQLTDVTLLEAEHFLKEAIDEYVKGGS